MAAGSVSRIGITETVLRDAPQSLIATRMPFEDFAEILPTLDDVGYFSLECWGGATFDACLRFLNEDPWQRLRDIRQACPNTKLQMLLRGRNLLGYQRYSDDVVRAFVARAVGNGIDIIRVFDALNDLRNVRVVVDEAVQRGADAQIALAYTISPVHTVANYIELAREAANMGATSICIKDMAGILAPAVCRELVVGIKSVTGLRLHVHSHCTAGLAPLDYLVAAEAGADVLDTAVSAFSGGTSQPATETISHSLSGLGISTGLDMGKVKQINDFFLKLRRKYVRSGLLDPAVLETDVNALAYQVPGGMLSNLASQLRDLGQLDRLDEVLAEVPKVRADLGHPPLVTPASQMVGAQAAANVISGQRYQVLSKEVQAYIRGDYGRPPGQINEALVAKTPERPPSNAAEATIAQTLAELPPGASVENALSKIMFPTLAVPRQPEDGLAVGSPSSSNIMGDYTIRDAFEVDDETAATLMAIVAHHLGVAVSDLLFNSIRRLHEV